MSLVDQASQIRSGEELDLVALDDYLKVHFRSIDSDKQGLEGEIMIRQFPGGASNLTYLVSYDNQEFILRRPPFGKIAKSAHDMCREAKIMQALKPVYKDIPTIFHICQNHHVIGCDFYLMERLVGIIPRENLPDELELSVKETRTLCTNVIDKLIELHQVNYKTAGLSELGSRPDKTEDYVTRQIKGWSKRYKNAITDDAATFEEVIQWLTDNMPTDISTCIIHNDFRFDNVVLDPEHPLAIIGVLDWEMATLGDPLMDLGNSLAYWVQADDDKFFQSLRRQPTHLEGMLSRDEVIEYYLEKSGLVVDSFDFYQIYGLFRLAAIIQQLYYRYYHGQTQDKRFAHFVQAGKYLEQRCLTLISNHKSTGLNTGLNTSNHTK